MGLPKPDPYGSTFNPDTEDDYKNEDNASLDTPGGRLRMTPEQMETSKAQYRERLRLNDLNYGAGGPNGAQEQVDYLQQRGLNYENMANNAQQRQGVNVDYGAANRDSANAQGVRGNQSEAMGLMRARAMGQVPSIAQQAAARQYGQAMAAQSSMAAGARGAAGLAMAQRGAAGNYAQQAGNIAGQEQIATGQERLAAEGAYMGAATGIRAQDYTSQGLNAQQSQYQANLTNAQRQQNDAYALGLGQQGIAYNKMGQDVYTQQLNARLQNKSIDAGVRSDTNAHAYDSEKNTQAWLGVSDSEAKEPASLDAPAPAPDPTATAAKPGQYSASVDAGDPAKKRDDSKDFSAKDVSGAMPFKENGGFAGAIKTMAMMASDSKAKAPSSWSALYKTISTPKANDNNANYVVGLPAVDFIHEQASLEPHSEPESRFNPRLSSNRPPPSQDDAVAAAEARAMARAAMRAQKQPSLEDKASALQREVNARNEGLAASKAAVHEDEQRSPYVLSGMSTKMPAEDTITSGMSVKQPAGDMVVSDPAAKSLGRFKPPPEKMMEDANRNLEGSAYAYKAGMVPADQKPGETNVGPMADRMATNPVTATAVKQDPESGLLMLDRDKALKVAMSGVASLQGQLDKLKKRKAG